MTIETDDLEQCANLYWDEKYDEYELAIERFARKYNTPEWNFEGCGTDYRLGL